MSGIKKKPVDPYVQELMDTKGVKEADISQHTGVNKVSVSRHTSPEFDGTTLINAYRIAKYLGKTLDEYVKERYLKKLNTD